MKNFLITLKIRCGEYEFSSKKPLKAKDQGTADKLADERASEFYGNPDRGNTKDGYFFDNGSLCVTVEMVREISLDEFNVLEKHL